MLLVMMDICLTPGSEVVCLGAMEQQWEKGIHLLPMNLPEKFTGHRGKHNAGLDEPALCFPLNGNCFLQWQGSSYFLLVLNLHLKCKIDELDQLNHVVMIGMEACVHRCLFSFALTYRTHIAFEE